MRNWELNFFLERQKISQATNCILIMSVFNGQIFDTLVSFLYFSWEKFPDNEFQKLFPTILKKSYLFILHVIIPLDAPYFLCHENKEIIIPKLSSLCDTELMAFVTISVIFSKMKNLYDWKIWLWSLPSSYPSHIYPLHWLLCQHLVYL